MYCGYRCAGLCSKFHLLGNGKIVHGLNPHTCNPRSVGLFHFMADSKCEHEEIEEFTQIASTQISGESKAKDVYNIRRLHLVR